MDIAPRIVAWVDVMDDLSGCECQDDDWVSRDNIPDTLLALLAEMGRVYVPLMLANGEALSKGAEKVSTTVDGKPWVQKPFPYQGKCLRWVKDQYAGLNRADRKVVDELLTGTGCEALFKD